MGAVSMRHPAGPRQTGFLIKFSGPSAWKEGTEDVVARNQEMGFAKTAWDGDKEAEHW